MKYLHEFRAPPLADALCRKISEVCTKRWRLMEICGGQTRTIIQYGLDQLLSPLIELIHGPGCPVCVTPVEDINAAIALAKKPGHILATFGDMVRVPGSSESLQDAKAHGADVRILYSPLDAIKMAQNNPDKQVIFFGIGFETSSVVTATAVHHAKILNIGNFSLLCCHVRVPAAIEALLASPQNTIQAFIAPGHVCAVMGQEEYLHLAQRFKTPFVITGFEPVDILQGTLQAIEALESGSQTCCNQYSRAVSQDGNIPGRDLLKRVFTVVDKKWRGIGHVPQGGFALNPEYRQFDAGQRLFGGGAAPEENVLCRMGDILRGTIKPPDCQAFGKSCRPEHPLGASMVSTEGACAVYFQFRADDEDTQEDLHDPKT
jgi:hydrogenase expression/formation protein HypD